MSNPVVSVIIPNYNQARYLGEAIQSVLDQTYRSFEIVVVDDGSTDNSRELVSLFGGKVRYLWQENQGLGAARNQGILAARGEIIGLLDADDEWHPAFLEKMVSLAAQHPRATVFYCGAQTMDEDGRELPQQLGGPAIPPETIYQKILRANFLIPSTILMRRSVLMAAGMFEQSIRSIHGCEDWDLWLRLLPKHLFVGAQKCLVRYRLHGESLSTNSARMKQAVQAVIEKNFGLDDGEWHNWTDDKKRAYGGIYRYQLLATVFHESDWEAGACYLRRGLQIDRTLATDLGLFYDLALGTQPLGHRGTTYQLDLEGNALRVRSLLREVFESCPTLGLRALHRPALGTAQYALGLIAYNTGQPSLSRHFFISALYYRPELFRDTLLMSDLMKSSVNRLWLKKMKVCADKG